MKIYKKIVIYYFTGTGNSKKVAEWISDIASEMDVETSTINIVNIDRLHFNVPEADTLIVFISPVHGFNYPPIMIHFIMRFPKGENNIALINTRAGMLIGKYITPGITGIAFYLSAILLKIKGYSIIAMYPVDLPSNWISVHPGLNHRTIKYLHVKNKERVSVFTSKIISGKSSFKSLYEIIQDLIFSPVAILYYFIGRFVFSKSYFASNDCNNCGICINNCPVKAIGLIDNRPFWTLNCESCMKCVSNCPQKAIEIGHGSIIGIMIIYYSVFVGLFYDFSETLFYKIENPISYFIIKTGLFLILLVIWYRIIHFLMRFKFFERLMVYTSLTKYKFWGKRYKSLNDNEFID